MRIRPLEASDIEDTEEFNRLSRAAHAALGFEEVETLVVFRKPLAEE